MTPSGTSYNQWVRDFTFCVIDFETTGLNPDQGDEPIEIGATLIQNGYLKSDFQRLVEPRTAEITPTITDITGLTSDDVAGCPSPEEALEEFQNFLKNNTDQSVYMVAHNADFDRSFFQNSHPSGRATPDPIQNWICSCDMSRALTKFSSNKLENLVKQWDVPFDNAHRAVEDTRAAGNVFLRLTEHIDNPTPEQLQSFGLPVPDSIQNQKQKTGNKSSSVDSNSSSIDLTKRSLGNLLNDPQYSNDELFKQYHEQMNDDLQPGTVLPFPIQHDLLSVFSNSEESIFDVPSDQLADQARHNVTPRAIDGYFLALDRASLDYQSPHDYDGFSSIAGLVMERGELSRHIEALYREGDYRCVPVLDRVQKAYSLSEDNQSKIEIIQEKARYRELISLRDEPVNDSISFPLQSSSSDSSSSLSSRW